MKHFAVQYLGGQERGWTPRRRWLGIGLALWLSLLSRTLQPQALYAQTPLTASQDAFVDPNNPTTAFNGQRLEVTYSNFPTFTATRRSLIQFNVATVASSLSAAGLVLQVVENNLPPSAQVNVGLYALADGWSESTVTQQTAPAPSLLLQTLTVGAGVTGQLRFTASTVGTYLESARTGDGIASLFVRLDSGSGDLGFGGNLLFEDREGSADGVNGNEPAIDSSTTVNLSLRTGWNLIGLPQTPNTTAPSTLFAPLAGQYNLIYAYAGCDNNDPWKKYDPAAPFPFLNDLTNLSVSQGLWVRVTGAVTLPVSGSNPSQTSIALCAGWNLIGWPGDAPTALPTALASITGQYNLVYAYDATDSADPWKKYDPAAPFPFLNDLSQMAPGKGYWIRATTATTLVVP